MFCRNVKNNLSAYMQGEVKPPVARAIEAHLLRCRKCQSEFEAIREGVRLAEHLQVVPAPRGLWNSLEPQIEGSEPGASRQGMKATAFFRSLLPNPVFVMTGVILLGLVSGVYYFIQRRVDQNASGVPAKDPEWSLNATIMEACSCPMFCQCYFNTKPAGHAHGDKSVSHFCRSNIAYKVNQGRFHSVKLDGLKFWLAGDVGADFSDLELEWGVLYFDKTMSQKQRDAIKTIIDHVMPVRWRSFITAEATVDRWEFSDGGAHATLDGGKTAEIKLKSLRSMDNEPVVIRNLKYWGVPRNDGFVLMPNVVQAYRAGPRSFEFKDTTGFVLTLDINSNDVRKSSGGSRPL
jgi:hypothetical protein